MGGSVGCSVFEEHHRAGIERERECTNQREGQKYDSHMLARRGICDTRTVDVAESVARLATAATTTQLQHNCQTRNTDKAQLLALFAPVFSLTPGALRGPQKTPLARVH